MASLEGMQGIRTMRYALALFLIVAANLIYVILATHDTLLGHPSYLRLIVSLAINLIMPLIIVRPTKKNRLIWAGYITICLATFMLSSLISPITLAIFFVYIEFFF